MLDLFGPEFLINLWKGLVGVEYLLRLRYETRPYELNRGEVDRVYRQALDTLVNYQAIDEVYNGIVESFLLLENVATRNERGKRAVIGVAGDIYTRINPAANQHLFEILEDMGCEVWPAPTMVDISQVGSSVISRRYWQLRRPVEMLASWSKSVLQGMEMWMVRKRLKGRLRNLDEPDGATVLEYTRDVLHGEPEILVSLNVSKHLDFANKGVHGILNVFCLNCMVGTTTAAVHPAIRRKVGDLPMMSLVLDGVGDTHLRNRLEAFVYRVRRYMDENAGEPGFDLHWLRSRISEKLTLIPGLMDSIIAEWKGDQ